MRVADLRAAVVTAVVALAVAGGALSADAREVSPEVKRARLMAGVKSWAYQLQKLDVDQLAASPFDLVVIDHAPDRVESVELMFPRADIERLKRKPDGSRRLVLAYLSIGEAERYRFYWDESWLEPAKRPAWLGAVNPSWAGNYTVEFWNPEWQHLIVGDSGSYVDRVIDEGFDGVYLDRADIYQQFAARPQAAAEMSQFIATIAEHMRTLKPDALVVLQNAEELLRQPQVRRRIDAVAKESLYHNPDAAADALPGDTKASVKDLRIARRDGHKVLVVEYTLDPGIAAAARRKAESDGFLIHFTERSLSQLTVHGPDQQPASANAGAMAPALSLMPAVH